MTTTVRVQPPAKTLRITISHQSYDDPDDGTGAGYYAWVGEPGEQSDFVIGPCASKKRAEVLARARITRMFGAIL